MYISTFPQMQTYFFMVKKNENKNKIKLKYKNENIQSKNNK